MQRRNTHATHAKNVSKVTSVKIIQWNSSQKILRKTVIGLGNFDGIHIGHQSLIADVIQLAKANNMVSAVLLFDNHTNEILRSHSKGYLTSIQDKIRLLSDLGVEVAYCMDFNERTKELSAEHFAKIVLKEALNIGYAVVGSDYHFGKKASGSVSTLASLGEIYDFHVHVTNPICDNGNLVSSTWIRHLVAQGEFIRVTSLLNRYYALSGTVVHGSGRGRFLNFPTANLELDFNYLTPRFGVYLTQVELGDKVWYGLTNIGTNPTFTNSKEIKIETFIMDFTGDIYNEHVSLLFIEKLRPDYRFDTPKALIEQMNRDEIQARALIKSLQTS